LWRKRTMNRGRGGCVPCSPLLTLNCLLYAVFFNQEVDASIRICATVSHTAARKQSNALEMAANVREACSFTFVVVRPRCRGEIGFESCRGTRNENEPAKGQMAFPDSIISLQTPSAEVGCLW